MTSTCTTLFLFYGRLGLGVAGLIVKMMKMMMMMASLNKEITVLP
jgi:hypothetical protein